MALPLPPPDHNNRFVFSFRLFEANFSEKFVLFGVVVVAVVGGVQIVVVFVVLKLVHVS